MLIALEETFAERDLLFEDTAYSFKSVTTLWLWEVQLLPYTGWVGRTEADEGHGFWGISEGSSHVFSVHHTLPSNCLAAELVALTASDVWGLLLAVPTSSH